MRKEILYAAMKKAAKVVIKRGFFPGAGQMLVKVKNGRLLLAARNANEHMLVMEETDAKNMEAIVEAAIFLQVVNKMPDGEISLAVSNGRLIIRSTAMKVGIPVMDAKGWPWPQKFEPVIETNLSPEITRCRHALGNPESNSLMGAYHLEFFEEGYRATALDGHRISIIKDHSGNLVSDVTVDGQMVNDALALTQGTVTLKTDGANVELSSDNYILSGKARPEPYFGIERMLETDTEIKAKVSSDELKAVLDVTSVLEPVAIFFIAAGAIVIRPKANTCGEGVFKIPAQITEGTAYAARIGVNTRYLLDSLNSIRKEEMELNISHSSANLKTRVITIDAGSQFEYILPVVIR